MDFSNIYFFEYKDKNLTCFSLEALSIHRLYRDTVKIDLTEETEEEKKIIKEEYKKIMYDKFYKLI